MNASARLTMKDAANCDKQCELQNSVNHQIFERTLRSRVFLGACLVSASFKPILPSGVQKFSLESANLCTSESLSKLATDALNGCVRLEITALCSTFTVFLRSFLLFRVA